MFSAIDTSASGLTAEIIVMGVRLR